MKRFLLLSMNNDHDHELPPLVDSRSNASVAALFFNSGNKIDPAGFYARVYFAINSGVNSGVKCTIKIGWRGISRYWRMPT